MPGQDKPIWFDGKEWMEQSCRRRTNLEKTEMRKTTKNSVKKMEYRQEQGRDGSSGRSVTSEV